FGYLGMLDDAATGKRRKVFALVFTAGRCQMVCVSPVLISERKIYEHGVRRQAASSRRRTVA
ncbi:hypothetical protein R4144_22255, partial [Gordonia amicalis]